MDEKSRVMKKLIVLILVMLLAFSADATMLRSPVSGNKSSPPEINPTSNLYQMTPAVMPKFVELSAELSMTAPPIMWGYNNMMTVNEEIAANIAIAQTSFFLGAGDRPVSDGISAGLDNNTATYTSENAMLKQFLGPGDRFVSGK